MATVPDSRLGRPGRDPGPSVDRTLEALRASGAPVTAPRRAVVEALGAADGHLDAAALADAVQAAHPDVHRSTIYRTLDRLVELGLVDHVHVAHGGAVYHLAGHHHLHAVCDRCGAIVDAPASLLRGVADRLERDHGFRLAVGHVALTGRCADCSTADR